MFLLAQINLALPSPWNWIGLAVSSTIFLGILGAIWGIYAKLGLRPPHKMLPLPKSKKYPALPAPASPLAALAEQRALATEQEQDETKLLASEKKKTPETEEEE